MPELQIDVAVANRFISSLSKSLQALCHGCMEFDSGIEIVGYININIDSGSKVDYVLNEKVLKSTTNSMTFVSNSFLAKKEQQKQTRDGVCSPIPQTQVTPAYTSRMRGAHFGSPYQRSTLQFSPHSQVLRGSQKRTRTDDFRLSPKKYHHNPSTESQYSGSTIQHSHLMSASATSSYSDSNFKQQQVPPDTDNNVNDTTLQLQMRIKEEALDADSQKDLDADDQKLDPSHDELDNFQVKSDPDETNSNNEETTPITSTVDNEGKNLKRNIGEPSSEDIQQPTEESNSQSQSDNHLPAFDLMSESAVNQEQNLTGEIKMQSTSAHDLADSEAGMSTENEPGSDAPVEYDQAAEDGSYSQSTYDDTGEGSSEAGQFEVIEIDDEDEDVQAMFGDHRISEVGIHRRTPGSVFSSIHTSELMENHRCSHCPEILPDLFALKRHIQEKHGIFLRHVCPQCGKAYLGRSGLFYHMQASHQMKSFHCPICSARFTRKSSIKAHLVGVHKMGQCNRCSALVKYQDYPEHLQQCCSV